MCWRRVPPKRDHASVESRGPSLYQDASKNEMQAVASLSNTVNWHVSDLRGTEHMKLGYGDQCECEFLTSCICILIASIVLILSAYSL